VTFLDARGSLELATALYCSAATGAAATLPIAVDHAMYQGWRRRQRVRDGMST
jgi:uncharacterized protein (TIGR03382 family)